MFWFTGKIFQSQVKHLTSKRTTILNLIDGQRSRFNKAPTAVDVLIEKKLRFTDISTTNKYCAGVSGNSRINLAQIICLFQVEGFIYTWGKCDFLREKHTILLEEKSNLRELKYYRSKFTKIEATTTMLFVLSRIIPKHQPP